MRLLKLYFQPSTFQCFQAEVFKHRCNGAGMVSLGILLLDVAPFSPSGFVLFCKIYILCNSVPD